jgi:hypothetical protein
MSFDPNNCELGEDGCKCHRICDAVGDDAVKYWECEHWGRSSLAFPRIGHAEAHYNGRPRHEWQAMADERRRKRDAALKKTEERLREIRHSDPVKHLAKKGVRVNR